MPWHIVSPNLKPVRLFTEPAALWALIFLFFPNGCSAESEKSGTLRPPSVPLVACDPYFSIWSPANKLTGADTRHWTGKPHRLASMVRINGQTFRVMGKEPAGVPPLPQISLEVLPTRSIYVFEGAGIRLTLTFTTACLPDDLMIYSRPLTYLTWDVQNLSEQPRRVEVYFDASGEIAVNEPAQLITCSRSTADGLSILKLGSVDQAVLAKRGDILGIDWGYLYVAASNSPGTRATLSASPIAWRSAFANHGIRSNFLGEDSLRGPGGKLIASFSLDLGNVGRLPVSRHLILAYDDEYSIQYWKQNLRPYWRRTGDDALALLKKGASDYDALKERCAAFDTELMADLAEVGGDKYARICALAYRQCYAATKVTADAHGQPLLFLKENSSSGLLGTVSGTTLTQFLFFSPSLVKAALVPLLDYAVMPVWRWPCSPHDLGRYPVVSGQVFGGGINQMPLDDTSTMLLLLATLATTEGNADFCAKYWPTLKTWAAFVDTNAMARELQVCSDDFMGELAHNANLSALAICALGGFAKLCELRGEPAEAREWNRKAKDYALQWVKQADDGDHFRLAFDQPGTWSIKYNLVWDRILGLDLFPNSVRRNEMDYYKTKQDKFGLPLDNRQRYAKLDWILWGATLTGDREDFDALVAPIWRFLNETPDRVPMNDWYWSHTARVRMFQARSTVGAVFLRMLYDEGKWKKWAGRDRATAAGWAPALPPMTVVPLSPVSGQDAARWRYTAEQPAEGWAQPDFDASSWEEGSGSFGVSSAPGATLRTAWTTSNLWLRQEFTLPQNMEGELRIRLHRSVNILVYVNGSMAVSRPAGTPGYEVIPIKTQARHTLRPGKNVIAVHCSRTGTDSIFDLELVQVRPEFPN